MTIHVAPTPSAAARRTASAALLAPMEYVFVKGLFVPPGLHRLYNATGLSVGLLAGRELMNVIVGHTPDGTPLAKEDVPLPLRPLHGLVNYNVYSDDPRDRWLHAIDNMAPAVLGAVGVLTSSRIFFRERMELAAQLEKSALAGKHLPSTPLAERSGFTIADADRTISMRHAEPWAAATAGSSLFGSASGFNLLPWPGNYASSLGALFGLRGGRKVGMASMLGESGKGWEGWIKNPLRHLTRTTANSPLGPEDMVRQAITHVVHNPHLAASELPELKELANGVLHAWVKHVNPAQVEAFAKDIHAYAQRMKDSGLEAKALDNVVREYLDTRFEAFLLDHKLVDMSSWQAVRQSLTPGENGWLGKVAEWAGARNHTEALRDSFAKGFYARHYAEAQRLGLPVGRALEETGDHVLAQPERSRAARKVGLAAGAGFLGMAALGSWSGATPDERDPHKPGPTHRVAAIVNGKPLDFVEWMGNALNFPPSLHRWKNALSLATGLYTGMKGMELLTGMGIRGERLTEFRLAKFMPAMGKIAEKPLLHYNFHGAGAADRWMKVLHMAVPAALGFYGNKLGSDWYFQPTRERVRKAEYIDDYSARIAFDQSKPWGYLASATSLTNVGVGLNFLPFSYGMNLGTRFTLGSDRKVVLPGVKEVWSNNHSRYPLGPAKLRDYMINYLVNNPDREPRQLEEMAAGVLGPWFGTQPNSTINQFAADVLAVRNKYYRDGGIPQQDKAKCKKELRERFVGKGLHAELKKLGLDVLNAHLADNGLSGDIANALGAKAAVARDISDFRRKEQARRAGKQNAESHEPAPEDRRPSFTERLALNRDQQQGTTATLH